MNLELKNTTVAQISSALVKARRNIGSPATGMVLTMVVATDSRDYSKVLDASLEAGREHPSRIILAVTGNGKNPSLDAEIRLGEAVSGEIIILHMNGPIADHPDSVVLPLLLPDSPVVVWWPGRSPQRPGEDPLGKLATRRITDAMGDDSPLEALECRATNHLPGDSDLTWTRLTPWRALLAAALDQYPSRINAAVVEAARDNAPANLLAAWLESRLGVDVERKSTRGPGITAVRLVTPAGDIALTRSDGLTATYSVPGQPKRTVALRRRDIHQLIAEELRRMDRDDIFEEATKMLVTRAKREAKAAESPKNTSTTETKSKGVKGA